MRGGSLGHVSLCVFVVCSVIYVFVCAGCFAYFVRVVCYMLTSLLLFVSRCNVCVAVLSVTAWCL